VLEKMLAGLFSGLMAAFMPACDGINLQRLKPGISTTHEVREIMGNPTREWTDVDGAQTWEYPRTPNGLVNYMIDFGTDQRLLQVRQVLTEENFARVQPGLDREAVRRLLGQPAHEQFFVLKKEHVWDWKTPDIAGQEGFFNVHFNEDGVVTGTSRSFSMRP
jgi:SmpA / OmlA family